MQTVRPGSPHCDITAGTSIRLARSNPQTQTDTPTRNAELSTTVPTCGMGKHVSQPRDNISFADSIAARSASDSQLCNSSSATRSQPSASRCDYEENSSSSVETPAALHSSTNAVALLWTKVSKGSPTRGEDACSEDT